MFSIFIHLVKKNQNAQEKIINLVVTLLYRNKKIKLTTELRKGGLVHRGPFILGVTCRRKQQIIRMSFHLRRS